MDILLQTACFLTVLLYASSEGIVHAILWSGRRAEAFKWNEHIAFNAQRILFFLAFVLGLNIVIMAAGLLCYPFFHNGFYYTFRNRIDGSYPDKWFDMTKDSSARFNFSVGHRVLFCILGFILFILSLITW